MEGRSLPAAWVCGTDRSSRGLGQRAAALAYIFFWRVQAAHLVASLMTGKAVMSGVVVVLGGLSGVVRGVNNAGIAGHTGEAGDAQDGAGAQIQRRGGGRVGLGQGVGMGLEGLGDGDEGVGVLGRGAVVDVVRNQVLEDGLKVLVGAVVEGIHGLGALQENDTRDDAINNHILKFCFFLRLSRFLFAPCFFDCHIQTKKLLTGNFHLVSHSALMPS